MASQYGRPPSEQLGFPAGSWEALGLDQACLDGGQDNARDIHLHLLQSLPPDLRRFAPFITAAVRLLTE